MNRKKYIVPIWIQINLAFAFCNLRFFFFFVQPAIVDKSTVNSAPVHGLRVPQITLLSNFFIKNWSHNIIYVFKNYFVAVFSVLAKINCIQTDPSCRVHVSSLSQLMLTANGSHSPTSLWEGGNIHLKHGILPPWIGSITNSPSS